MRKLIAVCGSDSDDPNLSDFALRAAEKVGYLLARKDAVLVCGGGGGVMEAACRGAKKAGGLTIGILPRDKEYANPYVDIGLGILPRDKEYANPYVDIGLASYLGRARNYILVRSCEVIIGIAGRWGTLNEIALSLNVGKPTVVIRGTGGWADILSNSEVQNLLRNFSTRPFIANSAEEAVEIAFKVIRQR